MKEENKDSWFKKHADTVLVLGGILAAALWIVSKTNDLDKKFTTQHHEIDIRLSRIETILTIKGLMATEICKTETTLAKPILKHKDQ